MNKNTYKYFKDRERKHQEEKIKDDEKFSKVLEKEYQRTLREIDNRINWWIGKYADDNVISVEQAKQIVTEADINELKEKAKEYVKNKDLSPKANKEMKIYNLKMKIARDELLQKYIDLELAKLGTKEEKLLEDRIFNETEEELKRQAGILGDSLISKNKVKGVFEQIVNDSHVSAHFSYYIWTNIKELRNDLQNGLNRSILRGQNPNVWKSDLYKYFKGNVKKAEFYARRLAVTETAIAQTKAGLISAKENGYNKVIIITEPGACKDCKPHDGNVVDLDEAEMGKNVPIWHPFCRCTVTAYYEYEDEKLEMLAKEKLESFRNIEPEVTKDMNDVSDKSNSKLVGLEYRLKGIDSLKRKIYNDAKEAGIDLETSVKYINDVLRYTCQYEYNDMTENVLKSIDNLKKRGYNLIRVKNTFKDGASYKGINTLVETSKGEVFELQFHTKESFELKNGKLHELYEESRVLDKIKDKEKVKELRLKMIELSKRIKNPQNIERIK